MKNAKKYEHLNQAKRDRIEALFSSGHQQKEIARILDVDASTISREKKRNRKKIRAKGGTRDGPYLASLAHHKAYARRHDARYQGTKARRSTRAMPCKNTLSQSSKNTGLPTQSQEG